MNINDEACDFFFLDGASLEIEFEDEMSHSHLRTDIFKLNNVTTQPCYLAK
jgi:hypothetical protein